MTKATHPIDALKARERAITTRLNEIDQTQFTEFDEAAHRSAIAAARADLARGLTDQAAVEALVRARDEARSAVEREAATRAAIAIERDDLADELVSVRAALVEEHDAQKHRRRHAARDIFGRTAEQFAALIDQAYALLPELVAAGIAAEPPGSPSPMPRLVGNLYLPIFTLEPDGRQTIAKRIYDPEATRTAIESLNKRLEGVA